MIYLGRIDESDTHGKAPDMVMSAMLGNDREWDLLSRRVGKIKREFGFSNFHTTDFKGLTGEFADWNETKCRRLIYDMGKAIAGTLTECVTVTCDYLTYRDHFWRSARRRCTK